MPELPDWVRKYKTKGIEIRTSHGKFYAYEMSSRWNREKKRADKITGEYLGVVTQQGIIKPRSMGNVRSDYEYGNIALLYGVAERTILPVLKDVFPYMYGRIINYVILREIQPLPMKSIRYLYDKTYLSRISDES
ncbi:MAG: IS1634 family transposase, partial [Thermoplasmata archaeon]